MYRPIGFCVGTVGDLNTVTDGVVDRIIKYMCKGFAYILKNIMNVE